MAQRATTTAHLVDHGVIEQGEIYADDDPYVKQYPQFFEDVDVAVSNRTARIEDTTARPGAKRGTKPKG